MRSSKESFGVWFTKTRSFVPEAKLGQLASSSGFAGEMPPFFPVEKMMATAVLVNDVSGLSLQVADAEPWFLTLTEVLHTYRSGKSPPAQLLFIPLVVVNELLLASVTA